MMFIVLTLAMLAPPLQPSSNEADQYVLSPEWEPFVEEEPPMPAGAGTEEEGDETDAADDAEGGEEEEAGEEETPTEPVFYTEEDAAHGLVSLQGEAGTEAPEVIPPAVVAPRDQTPLPRSEPIATPPPKAEIVTPESEAPPAEAPSEPRRRFNTPLAVFVCCVFALGWLCSKIFAKP